MNGAKLPIPLTYAVVQLTVHNYTDSVSPELILNVPDAEFAWRHFDGQAKDAEEVDLKAPNLGTIPPGSSLIVTLIIAALMSRDVKHAILEKGGAALPKIRKL